jgi:hypothetical protein
MSRARHAHVMLEDACSTVTISKGRYSWARCRCASGGTEHARYTNRSRALLPPRYPDAAASALIRCTTLLPVPNSRATLRMPLPLASAARMASSLDGAILALPIGLPLLVPCARALAMPAAIRS